MLCVVSEDQSAVWVNYRSQHAFLRLQDFEEFIIKYSTYEL